LTRNLEIYEIKETKYLAKYICDLKIVIVITLGMKNVKSIK
jgi:hypothetical protein